MIKVFVFDVGGVITKDPMAHIYKAVDREFKTSTEDIEKAYDKLKSPVETDKISAKEFWARLSKELGIKDTNLLKKTWMNSFVKATAPVDKSVVKIIKEIKNEGYRVAALSNTIRAHERLHRKLGHYKFFEPVFLSCRLGMRKPNIGIYKHAVKRLKVKAGECVFIDDKSENVASARKAGMNAVLFKNAIQLKKELKRYL
ncbi:MAG: HAD family phosphatase [Candidatus Aenigmarchaeota archaeon]|nr:HAD family phosphatase [Candidatus Aenigmarchaeota archaeon]